MWKNLPEEGTALDKAQKHKVTSDLTTALLLKYKVKAGHEGNETRGSEGQALNSL